MSEEETNFKQFNRWTDSTADIALVSSDGWRFEVQSYHLKSFSSVFRDMLLTATTTDHPDVTDGDLPIIRLTDTAESLVDLLDVMAGETPGAWPWDRLIRLKNLADKYDTIHTKAHIIIASREALRTDPEQAMEALVMAAQLGDVDLARRAIRLFDEVKDVGAPWDFADDLIQKVPSNYFLGLCRLYLDGHTEPFVNPCLIDVNNRSYGHSHHCGLGFAVRQIATKKYRNADGFLPKARKTSA